jgi:hypothetical protein
MQQSDFTALLPRVVQMPPLKAIAIPRQTKLCILAVAIAMTPAVGFALAPVPKFGIFIGLVFGACAGAVVAWLLYRLATLQPRQDRAQAWQTAMDLALYATRRPMLIQSFQLLGVEPGPGPNNLALVLKDTDGAYLHVVQVSRLGGKSVEGEPSARVIPASCGEFLHALYRQVLADRWTNRPYPSFIMVPWSAQACIAVADLNDASTWPHYSQQATGASPSVS